MMRGPGCAASESGPSGGGAISALMNWCPKPTTLSAAHVAADHSVRQPRLERLVDDAASGGEIASQRLMKSPAACLRARCPGAPAARGPLRPVGLDVGGRNELDLPHALSAIAAVLLENARSCRSKPRRKLFTECAGGAIEMGVGAPAQMLRAVQNFLHAHLEDHIRMRADPDSPGRDVAQHRIERPVLLRRNRIDPDEHAIGAQQLLAHLVSESSA